MIGGNQFRMGLALLMSFSIFGASNPIVYLRINRIVLIPVSRLANQIDRETGAISGQKKIPKTATAYESGKDVANRKND